MSALRRHVLRVRVMGITNPFSSRLTLTSVVQSKANLGCISIVVLVPVALDELYPGEDFLSSRSLFSWVCFPLSSSSSLIDDWSRRHQDYCYQIPWMVLSPSRWLWHTTKPRGWSGAVSALGWSLRDPFGERTKELAGSIVGIVCRVMVQGDWSSSMGKQWQYQASVNTSICL